LLWGLNKTPLGWHKQALSAPGGVEIDVDDLPLGDLVEVVDHHLEPLCGDGGGRCGSEARGNGGWDRNASDKADTFTTNGRNASFCSGTRKSQFQSVHSYFLFVHFFRRFGRSVVFAFVRRFFSIFFYVQPWKPCTMSTFGWSKKKQPHMPWPPLSTRDTVSVGVKRIVGDFLSTLVTKSVGD